MKNFENTKEKYLYEALKLFGENGYGSVTTTDIAHAVGCVPSALYKHYKSKQELYDAILEKSISGYEAAMKHLKADYKTCPEAKGNYLELTEEEQIRTTQELLLYALHSEWPSAFRKLMMVEQFKNKELARMYDERYVELQYEQYALLFQALMDAGKMKQADPYTLAVMYISPVTLMIGICDREPEKEAWALKRIEAHVIEFNKNYRIQ